MIINVTERFICVFVEGQEKYRTKSFIHLREIDSIFILYGGGALIDENHFYRTIFSPSNMNEFAKVEFFVFSACYSSIK